jgi:hypothetical protein
MISRGSQQMRLAPSASLAPRFDSVRLIVSDVDDTLAPPFRDISATLAHALRRLVGNGTILFLVSGQSIENIERRVIRAFPRPSRRNILVGHCHGAEVFGYDSSGWRVIPPLFSMRESAAMEGVFGKVLTLVTGVLSDHGIAASSPGTLLEDRGVQVTVDFPVLGVSPADQRAVLITALNDRLAEAGLPVEARMAGHLGIDIMAHGVDKSLPLSRLLDDAGNSYRLTMPDGQVTGDWDGIEVWGDQFWPPDLDADLRMLAALPPGIRAINFGTAVSFRTGAGAKPAGLRTARVPGPAGVLDYLVRDE